MTKTVAWRYWTDQPESLAATVTREHLRLHKVEPGLSLVTVVSGESGGLIVGRILYFISHYHAFPRNVYSMEETSDSKQFDTVRECLEFLARAHNNARYWLGENHRLELLKRKHAYRSWLRKET